jgi:hypothetical protein
MLLILFLWLASREGYQLSVVSHLPSLASSRFVSLRQEFVSLLAREGQQLLQTWIVAPKMKGVVEASDASSLEMTRRTTKEDMEEEEEEEIDASDTETLLDKTNRYKPLLLFLHHVS